VPLLVVIEFGTSKQKMLSWMKSMACLELILARAFSSTHLVNLSTAMSRWVKAPGFFFRGPKRSKPHTANGQGMGIV
jgi:hypothetical protein